jgi:hypothetical protein
VIDWPTDCLIQSSTRTTFDDGGVNPKQGKASLFSRHGKLLERKFPSVTEALNALPKSTVVDGEVVALDDAGRPDFIRS